MSSSVEISSATVEVEVMGVPSAEERTYAVEKISTLNRFAPVRSARIRIAPVGDRTDPQRVEVRVNLTGDRLFVHADAQGGTLHEAIDLVRARLYRLLTHERRRPRHATSRV